MNSDVSSPQKYAGALIEYLDQGRLKAALAIREQERHLAVIDSNGHERLVPRDLVLMRHPDRRADRETAAEALAELEQARESWRPNSIFSCSGKLRRSRAAAFPLPSSPNSSSAGARTRPPP